jgi:hypothetical protein
LSVPGNVQDRAIAVVDAFAHAGVDEEKQSETLKHFAVIALNAIGEGDFGGFVSLHDVGDAEGASPSSEKLFLVLRGDAGIEPLFPVSEAGRPSRGESWPTSSFVRKPSLSTPAIIPAASSARVSRA